MVSLSTNCWGAEQTLQALFGEVARVQGGQIDLLAPRGELLEWWSASGLGYARELSLARAPDTVTRFVRTMPRLARASASLFAGHDLVHSHHQWSHAAVAYTFRNRSVLDVHDIPGTRLGRSMQRRAAAVAGHTFAASSSCATHLEPHGKRVTILPRPVAAQNRDSWRRGRVPGKQRVGTVEVIIVARPDPWKRVGEGVSAMAEALAPGDRITLVGGRLDDYKVASTYQGVRVEAVGRLERDALTQLMSRADVHFLTSPAEPFGRTVVEAAAQGVPSIVFAGSGAAETVAKTRGGYVIAAHAELPALMRRIRNESVDIPALERIVETHAPTRVAQEYLTVVRHLSTVRSEKS
ncbi:glycosyltransferase family 4 protein [Microbacterium sp. NPDC006705]|uniref:glycosyltransferase family 4 protein n=1 Tax=Microbacterium sp. NPDC006705 TaxID=3364181 RepID=UPI00384FFD54